MTDLARMRKEVRRLADPKRAGVLRRFFRTGPGEYAEGDRFLGLTVPAIRHLVREFRDAPIPAARSLVQSPFHEERLLGLLLLVERYRRGDQAARERIYRLYLRSFPHIDNWDLVDATAEHVIGPHLLRRSKKPLSEWARSKNPWVRRIAILSTFAYIKRGHFDETFRIARILLQDPHDLIHKAVGWMLREVGKRDRAAEEHFLKRCYRKMPRTMLRCAIERFPERTRLAWLLGRI